MAINVLEAFTKGRDARRGFRANRLVDALAGQVGYMDFKPGESEELRRLAAIDPKRAQAMRESFNDLSKERQGAFFQDIRSIKDYAQAGEMDKVRKLLTDRRGDIQRLRGDTSDTDMLIAALDSDEKERFNALVDIADRSGVERGFLSQRGGMSAMDQAKLETELAKAAKYRSEVNALKNPPPINPEFLKEERGVARDSVKAFNKRGNEVLASYGKIDNILSGDGKLNRMKVASAMTSMARLLSPGIVTNQDFENLSNSANPASVLIDLLRGKGKEGMNVADELQRYGDPTNPELFDKEAFLQTARQVSGAEIPTLIGGYQDAQNRAKRAGVGERARKTYFGENSTLDSLQKMLGKTSSVMSHPVLGEITQEQLEETAKNKNMTVEQVLAELQKAQ